MRMVGFHWPNGGVASGHYSWTRHSADEQVPQVAYPLPARRRHRTREPQGDTFAASKGANRPVRNAILPTGFTNPAEEVCRHLSVNRLCDAVVNPDGEQRPGPVNEQGDHHPDGNDNEPGEK